MNASRLLKIMKVLQDAGQGDATIEAVKDGLIVFVEMLVITAQHRKVYDELNEELEELGGTQIEGDVWKFFL